MIVVAETSDTVPEVLEEDFENYQDLGGILDVNTYGEAIIALTAVPQAVLQDPNNPWWKERFDREQTAQLNDYANKADIVLLPKQRFLYCFLRGQKPAWPSVWEKPREGPKVSKIDDQPLLAEVFLMTNDIDSYIKLKTAYPVVFPLEK